MENKAVKDFEDKLSELFPKYEWKVKEDDVYHDVYTVEGIDKKTWLVVYPFSISLVDDTGNDLYVYMRIFEDGLRAASLK